MDNFLYPFDMNEAVFSQPSGHWKRRGASETLIALATATPGSPERTWKNNRWSQLKTLDSLVESGLGDFEGYTAWHYWAHGPQPELDFDRLKKLLPAKLETFRGHNGQLPTHKLLIRGADEAFKMWIKAFGAKAFSKSEETTSTLLKNASQTNSQDNFWHMIAWHGGEGRVQTLGDILDIKSIDVTDSRGLTAMMIAAHRGTKKDLEQWLLLGAHPDIKDRAGNTLLHHVARHGDSDWYGRMLDLGADDSIRNERGQKPRDILEDKIKHATPNDVSAMKRHWEIAYFHKTHF